MQKIYFPGCRIKSRYSIGSQKLAKYLEKKHGILPTGCCKENFEFLNDTTKALLICNNCASELKELVPNLSIEYVYSLINEDPGFPFPDYTGKTVLLQDCSHGYGDYPMGEVVRSLLQKMNLHYIPFSNIVPDGLSTSAHMGFVAENANSMSPHAESLKDPEIVTYCAVCNLGYINSGKTTHLLLDLLFQV